MTLGAGLTELILLVAMTSGVGIPLGIPPGQEDPFLSQSAPDNGLYYGMWVESQAPRATSDNPLEQLLAEPELRQFVTNAVTEAEAFLRRSAAKDSPQSEALADLGISLSQRALKGPGMMFVNKFELTETGPRIEAGLVLGVDDDQDFIGQINQAVELVMQVRPTTQQIEGTTFYSVSFEAPSPPVFWGILDSHLIVGVGEGSIEGLLARSKTPAPKWFSTAKQQAGISRLSTIGYLNLAGLRPLLEQAAPQEILAQVIKFTGADNMDQLVSVTGMDKEGLVSVTRLQASDKLHGLADLLSQTSLTAEDLSHIPADATVAIAFSLDAARVFDGIREFLGSMDPAAQASLDSGLALLKQEFDIDLRAGLLASLGTSWRVYTSPSHGNWVTGWAASIDVRDAKTMRHINAKISQVFTQLQEGQRQPLQIRTLQVEDHLVNYVVIPAAPFSPAWCITENELVIGLFTQTVKSHLARDSTTDSLAEIPSVASQLQHDKVVMLHYIDSAKVAEVLYPLAQVGLRALGQQLLEEGIDIKPHQFPAPGAIIPHLRPFTGLLTRSEDALVYRSVRSFPLGGNSITTAPITTALLLPAVQAARQAARQMASVNNLKQMGLAMHNWHNTHGALPAAYSINQDDKKLLSWQVHLLPFVEQDALYKQFRLDEPWDSEHNKKLIPLMPPVYRSPLSASAPGTTTYRAVLLPDRTSAMVPPSKAGQPQMIRNSKIFLHGHRFRDITDGTAQTIMVVEVGDSLALPWTKPDELVYSEKTNLKGWGAQSHKNFTTLFCDGAVRPLSRQIQRDHLKALITRAGGEAIPPQAFAP
ncbi:MAG: DUF1559 domain-containing protein [Pirellulaceae bacterium]